MAEKNRASHRADESRAKTSKKLGTMAADDSTWNAVSGPSSVPVVVPLPKEVIEKLKTVKGEVETNKNVYKKEALKYRAFPKFAAAFVGIAIEDLVEYDNPDLLQECVDLANDVSQVSLERLGIDKNQVLCKVAGTLIILLDLEEAVFRADLFDKSQHLRLRELVTKQEQAPTSKKTKPTKSPTKKKKHCMNGAQCRNILNGQCRFHHTPHEIAHAGAIIEELIGVSCCKVGWIIGTNGENISAMREESGADIWIEDQVLEGKIRMLHVLGSRDAVEKGIELVMEIAAACKEGTGVKSEKVEALVGISPSKQKLLLESGALETMKQASGAEIVAGDSRCSIQVVGTKENVEKGIHLLMEWGAQSDGKGTTDSMKTNANGSTSSSAASASTPPMAETIMETAPLKMVAPSIQATNRPVDAPADLDDDTAWPSLAPPEKPSTDTAPQRVPTRPAIPPKKNPKTSSMHSKVKKKEAMCIHGASCPYLRNGRDECQYYHSTKEIQLATERYADRDVEHIMYMSRKAVSYIIGKKGSVIKQITQRSGAVIANDPVNMGNEEDRVMRICGTQKSVDIAYEMIIGLLPEYEVRAGPEESTSIVVSVSSDSPEQATVVSPADASPPPANDAVVETPTLREPSPTDSQQLAHLALPPQPIQQLPPVQQMMGPAVLASTNTSISSGSDTLLPQTPVNSPSLAVIAYESRQVVERSKITSNGIAREPISISASSIPNRPAPGITPLQPKHVNQQDIVNDMNSARQTFQATKPAPPTTGKTLLEVLQEQKGCLKGSPEAFGQWLSTEDIHSLKDLAEAVSDDDYLREVLQQGNGTVGVKGFKRNAFKHSVLTAGEFAKTTDDEETVASPNDEPLTELLCPISHNLMTEDPVIAADGYTYERTAIEEWFQKQLSEVSAAKQQMATVGADSQRARGIIERGVLSPMTHMKMPHLNLTPNHAMRNMARDAASSSK